MIKPFQFGPWEHRISSARASNGKFALVQQLTGGVHLYTVEGHLVRVLPSSVRSDTQNVFSRTSQDHIFLIPTDRPEIHRHSLIDDMVDVVATFPQFVTLSSEHAEGDLTPDGWLALAGIDQDGTEHAFCYNVHTQQSGGMRQFRRGEIDGLKAAYGGWLVVSNGSGIRAYPPSGPFNWLASANGHACTAVYQGRPKLLWFSNARRDPWQNGIELIDIENPGDRQVLMDLGTQNYAGHVSAGPDFAIISIYDPTTVLPSQIWRVPFDGSQSTLLFEWIGPYREDATPRASWANDLVVFNRWDGREQTAWGLSLKRGPEVDEIVVPPVPSSRVDYSTFVGKKYWLMVPREDGALDIIEKAGMP